MIGDVSPFKAFAEAAASAGLKSDEIFLGNMILVVQEFARDLRENSPLEDWSLDTVVRLVAMRRT